MKLFEKWLAKALVVIISGAIAAGCVRSIGVTPVSPTVASTATFTSTQTSINTNTSTATSTPTSVFTNTYTATNTSTATSTNTNLPGSTNTFTSTATNTSTSTYTPTITYTPTWTNTVPPGSTNTFTFTITNTPTATFTITQTPTPTNCMAAAYQVSYPFDTTLNCWSVDPASATYVTASGINNSKPHTGAGSFMISVNNTSGANQNISASLFFSAPQNLTGMQMVAYVWVDASLTSSSYASGLQVFDQSPIWKSGNWNTLNNVPPTGVNQWLPVTIIFGANGDNAANVTNIGFQLTAVPAGASGNFYIDDVQIIAAPPTPTFTNTVAGPTNTFTTTPTPTITNTVGGPTSTPTNCTAASWQASEGFETSLDCWSLNPLNSAYVTAFGANGVNPHTGSQSVQCAINNTSLANQSVQIWLNFTTPQNLTGYEMTAYVWVDATLGDIAPAYNTGLQVFDQSPGFTTSSVWTTIEQGGANVGAWVPVTIIFGAQGDTASTVSAIGFQLTNVVPGRSGSMYLDDVHIFVVPPTPTPTNYKWTFEDGTNQYWTGLTAGETGSGGCTSPVTTFGEASSYGLDMNIPAGNITNSVNTFRTVVTSASGSPVLGTGVNWSALGLTSVVVDFYISAPSGYLGTQYPYIIAGSGPTTYGGTYGSWSSSCNSSGTCVYDGNGAWQTITFTPSGPNWATDMTNVIGVGFEVNISANATFPGEDYILDNIRFQ